MFNRGRPAHGRPAPVRRPITRDPARVRLPGAIYFAAAGFAFLFIERVFFQRFVGGAVLATLPAIYTGFFGVLAPLSCSIPSP